MIKLLLPARDIPAGSVVTKKTGTQKLVVKEGITIYNSAGKLITIDANDNARLLISPSGAINVVAGDEELVWEAEEWEAREILDEGHYLTEYGDSDD